MLLFEHNDSLRSAIRRVIFKKVDDSGTQQKADLTGLKSEKLEKILRIQPHGFHSVPPEGSEGVIQQMGGRSDRSVVHGGEHKDHKPKDFEAGESGMYDAFGKLLQFFKDKTLWNAGNKPWTLENATTVKINGKDDVAVGVDGRWVRIRPGRVDLGIASPTDEAEHGVETSGGTSTKVFAVV